MTSVDANVVGVGVAFFGLVGMAIWKAGELRSKVVEKFKTRQVLASAELDEHAANVLRTLAKRVNEMLGDIQNATPTQVIHDPAELQSYVGSVNSVLKANRRLPDIYKQMTRTGPRLVILLTGLLITSIGAFSYFAGFHRLRLSGYVCMWTALGFLAISATVGGHFILLLHRFSGAELLSPKSTNT